MLQSLLICFLVVVSVLSVTCPPGYSDGGDGSCYGGPYFTIDRNSAYYYCSQHGAYLYDIVNSFQNSDVKAKAGKSDYIWLGLTCTSSSQSSCMWDSGAALTNASFSNFGTGGLNTTIGACTTMDVKTGLWYSADCSNSQIYYGCKYTPGITVPRCTPSVPKTATFRGRCYYPVNAKSLSDAASVCSQSCGTVASIHSEGQNSFVGNLAHSFNPTGAYIFIGLKMTNNYTWQDGSAVDYLNFGLDNVQLGVCVTMATTDGFVKFGKWINSQCDGNLVAVCQKDVDNICDRTTTTPATTSAPIMAPVQCGDPAIYVGTGMLYSPGYPMASIPNHCEYLITEDQSQVAVVSFYDGLLDSGSYIDLYSSLIDTVPYRTYRNTDLSHAFSQSPTNVIRLVYNTTGLSSNSNFWSLKYSGVQ